MTRWGAVLLVAFVALGLSRFGTATSMRAAALLTGAVLFAVWLIAW